MDAWNTGHNGGILTIHANSPKLALRRIHDLIRMKYEKGEFKSMIGDSVDIVVHMDKVGDISRKVHSIISVKGYNEEKQDYIIVNECVEGYNPLPPAPSLGGVGQIHHAPINDTALLVSKSLHR